MEPAQPSSAIGTPPAEVTIDTHLVQALLTAQHPDLADLPLQLVDAGWDNTMFRLGDHLAVRLPRRQLAAQLIENEQTWLPLIADRLTLPVPNPYRIGKPALGYPWCWSVLPWLPGITADQAEPLANQAQPLALFLRSLHVPAPPNTPLNNFRGVPLADRATAVAERIQRLTATTNLISPVIQSIWQQALQARIDTAPTWLHGDLHPRNVLVEQGAISGIIDWGDLTAGDIATDLAAIWMLLADRSARQQAIDIYGHVSESTRSRALGWAILFGIVLLDTGLIDNPRNAAIGQQILQRVAED
jgi:aminoglycoside phosphotransferase (APT) family kinase protein